MLYILLSSTARKVLQYIVHSTTHLIVQTCKKKKNVTVIKIVIDITLIVHIMSLISLCIAFFSGCCQFSLVVITGHPILFSPAIEMIPCSMTTDLKMLLMLSYQYWALICANWDKRYVMLNRTKPVLKPMDVLYFAYVNILFKILWFLRKEFSYSSANHWTHRKSIIKISCSLLVTIIRNQRQF